MTKQNMTLGTYANEGKRLLKAPNVKRFQIAEGCEEVDARAFDDCEDLVSLYFPLSMSDDDKHSIDVLHIREAY